MSNQLTNKNSFLKITKAIRQSRFLALNSPQDFQTLIALCAFADVKGKLKISSKTLAFALNLSEKQASQRLQQLLALKWQGKPLVVKESHYKFTPNWYRLMLPGAFMRLEMAGQNRSSIPEAEVCHNVVVSNTNKTTDSNKPKLIKRLKAEGVTEATAQELIEEYPPEKITAQLDMLPHRHANNPAGMLIKAIRENWEPPQAYKELKEQETKERKGKKKKAKELARRKAHQHKIEAIKAKMSKTELSNLRERAKQKIAQVLRESYGDNLPEILIEAEMNSIIGTEYLKK
jgi:hypothetical protein